MYTAPQCFRRSPLCRSAGAALLVLALSSPVFGADLGVPGAGGLKIAGENIPADRIWAEYRYRMGSKSAFHGKKETLDKTVLETSVNSVLRREVLRREAAGRGYTLSEDDRAAVRDRQIKAWRGEDNFRIALAMLDVSEEYLLDRIGADVLASRMAADGTGGDEVRDGDLRAHYEKNIKDYIDKSQPPLRYIYVPRDYPPLRKNPRTFMWDTIGAPRTKLAEEGKRFDSLVREVSHHESASRGGIFAEEDLPDDARPYLPRAEGVAPCRQSRVLPGDSGYHLFLRDCMMPFPFEEIRDRVRNDFLIARRSAYLQELFTRLRGEIGLELIDLDESKVPAAPDPGSAH